MAYMIPSSMTTCNTTAIELRSLTTAKRRMKLDLYMTKVSVPHCFTALAAKHSEELNNNIAIVCDGGIDKCIPLSPPPSKVNPLTTVVTKYFHRSLTSMFRPNCYSEKEFYQGMECAQSAYPLICSTVTSGPFHGYVAFFLQWMSHVHINPSEVGIISSPQNRSRQNIRFSQPHTIHASGIAIKGSFQDHFL